MKTQYEILTENIAASVAASRRAYRAWVLRYGGHLTATERTAWDQGFESGWIAATKYAQELREDVTP